MLHLGTWQLVPELSHYDQGGPPDTGTYRIEADGNILRFHISWQAGGKDHAVIFAAPLDGREIPSEFPGIDSFAVLLEGPKSLVSTATASGRVVMRARRLVSDDGALMSIRQDNIGADGSTSGSFQVYRRA
jgi:hypothetical protein